MSEYAIDYSENWVHSQADRDNLSAVQGMETNEEEKSAMKQLAQKLLAPETHQFWGK